MVRDARLWIERSRTLNKNVERDKKKNEILISDKKKFILFSFFSRFDSLSHQQQCCSIVWMDDVISWSKGLNFNFDFTCFTLFFFLNISWWWCCESVKFSPRLFRTLVQFNLEKSSKQLHQIFSSFFFLPSFFISFDYFNSH